MTTWPSSRLARSFSLSALLAFSRTSLRETTTLLRWGSIFLTRNSSSLPSRWETSLTGRTSTREPGRNARMPAMSTVKPPLTLPLMTPITLVPSSAAFWSLSQASSFLAFSREVWVSPLPLSIASRTTGTWSPTLTSSSPAAFLNCSTGMKDSVLSPVSIRTYLSVILETVPFSGLSVCELFLVAEDALANGVASKALQKIQPYLKVKKVDE